MIKYCKNKKCLINFFLFQFVFHVSFFILQIQYDKFKSKLFLIDFNFYILLFGFVYNFIMIFDSIIIFKMKEANYKEEISSLFFSIFSDYFFSIYFSVIISHSIGNILLHIYN